MTIADLQKRAIDLANQANAEMQTGNEDHALRLFRESEKVICEALAQNDIPNEDAEKLRNLYEDVNFYRHLRLESGIVLNDNEIQLSVSGQGVGLGMAREEDVIQRIQVIKQMSTRTFERGFGKPFRKKGGLSKDIQSLCSTFWSVPRAGSFTMNIRLGLDTQTRIPNIQSVTTAFIDDMFENVELANSGEIDKLSKKIQDPDYLLNMVGLAKELAPDGEDVRQVGLTCVRDGVERSVGLTRTRDEYNTMVERAVEIVASTVAEIVDQPIKQNLSGLLIAANSEENVVSISNSKKKTKIIVPDGLADIVRKYFGEQVVVSAMKQGRIYTLVTIDTIKTI